MKSTRKANIIFLIINKLRGCFSAEAVKYIKAESQDTVYHSKGAMHCRNQMDIDGNVIFQSSITIKKLRKDNISHFYTQFAED